jgi:hypothetical protein
MPLLSGAGVSAMGFELSALGDGFFEFNLWKSQLFFIIFSG